MKKMICSLFLAGVLVSPLAASEAQLHAIGSLSAGNVYLMYLSIGTVADAYGKGVYDKEMAGSALRALIGQAGVQKESLDALKKDPEVVGDDLIVIDKIILCMQVLVDEAVYVQKFIDTGERRYAELFDQKRVQAWQMIEELFGKKMSE